MIALSKILSHLPENKIKELESITKRIVGTKKAEIVILFGSYARGNYKEQRGEGKSKKSDYDILVATSDADTRKGLRSKLRGMFKDISIPVQLIVEKITAVNKSLEEKQYFFTDIKREGKVLYNSGNFELSDPKELAPSRRREIAEADFKIWITQAKCSFEDAENNKQKCKNSSIYLQRTSFHLQQVVEMCYTAIEMVFDHYNPYEHNLEALRYRVLKFDQRIKKTLPYDTEEQRELFDYLNLAYIGGRYHSEEEFPVTKKQLDYWSIEAQKLLGLTEKICKERINCFIEIENRG